MTTAQPVTLVTGASRGIGRAIADRLAAKGGTVIGLSRSRPEAPFPGPYYAADMADADGLGAALAEITRAHAVTGLVNNAGVITVARLEDQRLDDLDQMWAVNLRACLQCAQAVVPGMKAAGWGRIVNIGSRAALGKDGRGGYGATKAALVGLTRSWALELAEHGVTVNAIAPGPIETELFRANTPAGSEADRRFAAAIPVKRMGRPDEVAAATEFFLSADAGFVTGQVLYVCGGLSVGLAPL